MSNPHIEGLTEVGRRHTEAPGGPIDSFGSRDELRLDGQRWDICRLDAVPGTGRLPFSLKVLVENLLRHEDGVDVTAEAISRLAAWEPDGDHDEEVRFTPGRVLLHDTTGLPAAVDLAAMRDAAAELGVDPTAVDAGLAAHLVIDHSISAAVTSVPDAFLRNAAIELERNHERYRFLKWAEGAFSGLRVVPPNTGSCTRSTWSTSPRWSRPATGGLSPMR